MVSPDIRFLPGNDRAQPAVTPSKPLLLFIVCLTLLGGCAARRR
jgi:hypothetical protein